MEPKKRALKTYGGWFVGLIASAAAAAAYFGFTEPPDPLQGVTPAAVGAMGWVNDPDSVNEVIETLPVRGFNATPAYRKSELPAEVFLWDAARKVTGSTLPPRNQKQVGSCVAFGAAAAIEHLICVQIARGSRETYRALAQEVIYGGSRVEIGGGRIRGDGSVGAWAAQWCQKYGVAARDVYGTEDLREYSEATCRLYGSRGVPDVVERVAKQFPVKTVTPVRTAAECRAALASGYPVTVASSQGFVMTRDKDGFCRPSGTWQHQMAILGYQTGKRSGFWIQNSWGPGAHTGPKGVGHPPEGGFWADASVVERMLGQGDSWAYGDLDGFPARDLDWLFIGADPADAGRRAGLARRPEVALTLAF